MNSLDVTLIQSGITWHDKESNLARFAELILPLEDRTDLIVLPEMFNTGFTMEPATLSEDMNGPSVSAMKEWSRITGADIAGSIIVHENGRYYNRLLWVKPDAGLYYYDKSHLFRMAAEHDVYTAGKKQVTVELKGWLIRPCICYDLRFPVWLRNTGADSMYDLLVCCANWPAARQSHWDILLRARAVENQCYAAGVNRTGMDGKDTAYTGGSAVIDYRGNTIAAAGDAPGLAVNTVIQKQGLEEYRRSFPAWMDADRFSIY